MMLFSQLLRLMRWGVSQEQNYARDATKQRRKRSFWQHRPLILATTLSVLNHNARTSTFCSSMRIQAMNLFSVLAGLEECSQKRSGIIPASCWQLLIQIATHSSRKITMGKQWSVPSLGDSPQTRCQNATIYMRISRLVQSLRYSVPSASLKQEHQMQVCLH